MQTDIEWHSSPFHLLCALEEPWWSTWPPAGRVGLRSAECGNLAVRRTTELSKHSFHIAAPAVCNSLHDHLHSPSISKGQFRCGLKTHRFLPASLQPWEPCSKRVSNWTEPFHAHVPVLVSGFAVVGPCLWNSLPANLRQMTSCGQFRRHEKAHFFRV